MPPSSMQFNAMLSCVLCVVPCFFFWIFYFFFLDIHLQLLFLLVVGLGGFASCEDVLCAIVAYYFEGSVSIYSAR